ncbi:NAD(P)/FAD-dependent oxidoreductase [Nocardioides halotolerans]|uniref:NAD(P)/FAD-dependent oxidoreductase n=1 Tax=Nocardioides halotolerans TaxID=433660 RepID=UPI00048A4C05|nr:FAD-dependent oxidoreductase [Nocardioides halotolerans]
MASRTYDTASAGTTTLGGVSFWLQQVGVPEPSDALEGDRTADVCIVGGGLTGLWAAYYLKLARPDWDVVVLEREFAGFGASGRNAGWLSSELAGKYGTFARRGGRDAVQAMVRAMNETVDEVLTVCTSEGIDADAHRGGVLRIARNPVEEARLRHELATDAEWDVAAGHRWLSGAEVDARLRMSGAVGAAFNEYGARIHPAKLVRGLAAVVRGLGVRIHEGTEVRSIEAGRAVTSHGTVTAPVVLRCLEGFTAGLPGLRREWLPMNSSLIATAPLPEETWSEIGWEGREVVADGANAYACAQRTEDGRIVLGGRGMLPRYRYASRPDHDGITTSDAVAILTRTLHDLFPMVRDAPIEHGWCGVLGVPRDWTPSMVFDPGTGLGWAGGYVGSGVSTTNLAGRVLRDLVTGVDTPLTRLPLVGHHVRKWEPEPVRWLGVRTMYHLYKAADRREAGGLQRESRLTRLGALITGR